MRQTRHHRNAGPASTPPCPPCRHASVGSTACHITQPKREQARSARSRAPQEPASAVHQSMQTHSNPHECDVLVVQQVAPHRGVGGQPVLELGGLQPREGRERGLG